MNASPRALTELIGSRICHDLISPIGAISNGVELITMSGALAGPELSLISESVENANAKIRFFRIAFGTARAGQKVGRSEIISILDDSTRGSRLTFDWQPEGEQEREAVKLAFLLLLCFESAMPWGGRVSVNAVGNQWALQGRADQMKFDPELWNLLSNADAQNSPEPSNVHFALTAMNARELGLGLQLEQSENSARVRF